MTVKPGEKRNGLMAFSFVDLLRMSLSSQL